MIDFSIIKLLLDKHLYEKYYPLAISLISNPDTKRIAYSIKSLYSGDISDNAENREVYSVDDAEINFYLEYPSLRPAEKDLFGLLFKRIRETEVNETLVEEYLKQLKQRSKAHEIAVLALDVEEGRKQVSHLIDSMKELDTDQPLVEDIKFVTSDLNELYELHAKQVGLRWRLKSLNASLGSLRKGDFGFLFARPETGKTSFLADQISFMAAQTDSPILWFNNEEQGEKVMRRIYTATLGITERELFSNLVESQAKFLEHTKDNICVVDEAQLHRNYVEKVVKQTQPSLIIFDQIDKIKGFDEDRNDLLLGKIYQWARELAKTYCPVIAVCQADGQGEGVKWLTMGHVSDAKTSKQAEADWILGIGKSNDSGYDNVRYLNISKNKLCGDIDSIPAYRHGRFETILIPDICRYEDVAFS